MIISYKDKNETYTLKYFNNWYSPIISITYINGEVFNFIIKLTDNGIDYNYKITEISYLPIKFIEKCNKYLKLKAFL